MTQNPEQNEDIIRILLVEDMSHRYEFFKKHTPAHIRIVWAKSGGAALRVLQKDEPDTYSAVLLDFDLYEKDYVSSDTKTNGAVVAKAIAQKLFNDIPVLVHSMNPRGAKAIIETLRHAGFSVSQIRFSDLTPENYVTWLAPVTGQSFHPGDTGEATAGA